MGFLDIAKNVVTLGGHSRLENAISCYHDSYARYRRSHAKHCDALSAVKLDASALIHDTRKAVVTVEKAISVVEGRLLRETLVVEQGVGILPTHQRQRSRIDTTTWESEAAIGKGVGAGSAIAGGSWLTVAALGSASTGTAISSLGGAAAANATLAWFGGGSLAAGGAGGAGGAMVLGGFIAAPLVVFAAWSSRSRADEIDRETHNLMRTNDEIDEKTREVEAMSERLKVARRDVVGAHRDLKSEFRFRYWRLFRFGFVSRVWRRLLLVFGRGYRPRHVEHLDAIDAAIRQFFVHSRL